MPARRTSLWSLVAIWGGIQAATAWQACARLTSTSWQPQALGSSTPSALRPLRSPRRASLATGRYPYSHGVMGLSHGGFDWDLPPQECHAAAQLAAYGYQTHVFGVQHVTPNAVDGGDVGFPGGRADCLTALPPSPPRAPRHAAREHWCHWLMMGEQPTV
jgi:hypothetical protein